MSTKETKKKSFPSEEESPVNDLHREAENMLELLSRQSDSFALTDISSKQALAVIRQF